MYRHVVVYAVLAMIMLAAYDAYAVESSTEHGSIRVDPAFYILDKDRPISVKITGEIFREGRHDVQITVTKPNLNELVITTVSARSGAFEASIPLTFGSDEGTYHVSGSASGNYLGNLTFGVLRDGVRTADQQQQQQQQQLPEQDPMTVTTDRNLYDTGSVIRVFGEGLPDESIALQVFSPSGSVVFVNQIMVDGDGKYSTTVRTDGGMWSENGIYGIKAGHTKRTVETNFLFKSVGAPIPAPVVEPPASSIPSPAHPNSTTPEPDTAIRQNPAQPIQHLPPSDPASAAPGPAPPPPPPPPPPIPAPSAPSTPSTPSASASAPSAPSTPSAPSASAPSAPSAPSASAPTQSPSAALAAPVQAQNFPWVAASAVAVAAAVGATVLAAYSGRAGFMQRIVLALKTGLKNSASKAHAPAAAAADETSTLFFFECPKCHSPNMRNDRDGSVLCLDCGFSA